MNFLLNNQVEIISCDFQKDENGNFFEVSESLGFFFAEVKEIRKKNKVSLNVVMRENQDIPENFKIIFDWKEYSILSILEKEQGFISIACERQKV